MINRDRTDYVAALAEAEKEEALLNVVRLQHGDVPAFMTVSTIVSSYRVEGRLGASSVLGNAASTLGLDSHVLAADSPTITYTPLRGGDLASFLLRPIRPVDLLTIIESGAVAEMSLLLAVNSINGVRNDLDPVLAFQDVRSPFAELVAAFGALLRAGVLGFEFGHSRADDAPSLYLYFQPPPGKPEVARLILRVKRLLNLPVERDVFEIVYGRIADEPAQIGILTRTVFQMLRLPGLDQPAGGRALPPPAACPAPGPLIEIEKGPSPPRDAYVAVPYDGQWYWIPPEDDASKRAFTLIQILMTLAQRGTHQQPVLLAVPTG